MATILRSSKYIRCLNGLTQRIVVAHENNKFVTKSLALQVQCTSSYLTKSYATIPAIQRAENVGSFDKMFNKLDENIQRSGRVFKPEVESILSKVRDAGYISSLDALLLIRCCGDLLIDAPINERNQITQEIWTTLDTLKIRMDVSHFNALLRVYLENNYEFSPIEFLTTMKDKRVEPNRVTYQRLMLHHCKKGDIDGATKILEFMKEKGLPLNEGVFNALITGHSEANDIESAKNILSIMKDAGVEPCSSTYTALLCAYAKRADMESIIQTLKEIESKNLYLQDSDFFEIIQVLASNGHDNEVDQILAIIPKAPSYNIHAVQAILKILDMGNLDTAMKILLTMKKRNTQEDRIDNESGTFFIRKLVNTKYPVEKIAKVCEKLEQDGLHSRAFSVAVERALENGDLQLSTKLLEEWMKHGGEMREHYFWPLLAAHGKTSNYQGIIDTVNLMSSVYQVVPDFETIKDYILPYTLGRWQDILETLKELKIPQSATNSAIASRMLSDNKIRKTAMFMTNYPAKYEAEHFYRPLVEAVIITDDAKSYAIILRILYESAISSKKSTGDGEYLHTENVVDNAIRILIDQISGSKYETVNKILENLEQVGLSISPEVGVELRQYFQDNMNPITDERIEKLTSGTLTPISINEFKSFVLPPESADGEAQKDGMFNEERLIFSMKRRQLETAIKNENIEAAQNLIMELEQLDFKFSPALCAIIIEAACKMNDLEMARKWVAKAKADPAGFSLDLQKVTKYAALLIKNDCFDDAVQFILETPRAEGPENHGVGLRKLVKNLLDTASETGDVEKTKELFEALEKAKYLVIDNYMLGSLVKVHLIKNDFSGALEAFENACVNHGCTPMKNELSTKFIDNEDANSLQKLTDLSTEIHGESNSLVDLVLSFIECGRLRQARKILETPGLRLRGKKLKVMIDRYTEDGRTDYLDQFVEISKGLPVIDRREFYDHLMDTYSNKGNWQRGLNLWTAIQDEDLQPSDGFLKTLSSLLKRNGQPIPFDYEISLDTHGSNNPDQSTLTQFHQALKQGELQRAEELVKSVSPKDPNFNHAMSSLIERIASEKNDLDKACELTEVMITKYEQNPSASVLKYIWNGFINNAEFEKLRRHGNILSTKTKKYMRFAKYLSRAELKQVGLTKFLDNFESKLTNVKSANFEIVRDGLHFTSLVEEFKKDPQAVEKFHKLAEKLSEQDIFLPINAVWSYYFEQNHPEAEALWNKHLSHTDRVMFKYIINRSKNCNDVELMERLYNKLQTNNHLSTNSKVLVLSSLIDLYNKNSRYEDSLKVVESLSSSTIKTWIEHNPMTYRDFTVGLATIGKSFQIGADKTRLAEQ